MEINVRKENNTTVVSVSGKMDTITAPEFDTRMDGLISEGENSFIVDLGELIYISSAGLKSLLASAKKLTEKQGKILLAAVKGTVSDVFKISGFNSIFQIFDSVEDALKQV